MLVRTPTSLRENWLSDLTATNTVRIDALQDNSRPPFLYKENLYFSGHSEREGQELWRADPAFSRPELFMNINQSGWGLDTYLFFASLDDQILFRAT
jgi:ELWxxDGT repeat protein